MNIDYNEFLRIMSCILIALLIFQGMDYIFGVGVNNYLFIIFCIAFAFTMGTIYHNILEERNRKDRLEYEKVINDKLDKMQSDINAEYMRDGLTASVMEKQSKLEEVRLVLDIGEELEFDDNVDINALNQLKDNNENTDTDIDSD